ncbi:MAG TPA: hypothetical protein PKD55_25710 [Bellilinea sp.]|nr:hypothetical protein [Bellilinea sp.]
MIQLAEGPVVTARLTDPGEQSVEIGMPVERITRLHPSGVPAPVRCACTRPVCLRDDGSQRGMLVYGYPLQGARTRFGCPKGQVGGSSGR